MREGNELLAQMVAAEKAERRPGDGAADRIWPRVQARVGGELPAPAFTRGGLRLTHVAPIVAVIGIAAAAYAWPSARAGTATHAFAAIPEVGAPAATEPQGQSSPAPSIGSSPAEPEEEDSPVLDAPLAGAAHSPRPNRQRRRRPEAGTAIGKPERSTLSELEIVRRARAALGRRDYAGARSWINAWKRLPGAKLLTEEARAIDAALDCAAGRIDLEFALSTAARVHHRLVRAHCPPS
jgi:hypothetical protein